MPSHENDPAPIPPALRQAFEETHYTVHHEHPFTLRIGQPSPELDQVLRTTGHDSAAFVTAWTPMCQLLSVEDNHQRQQALKDELQRRGLAWVPGIGQHPDNGWPGEESVLVLGIAEQAARTLCAGFQQMAFVACKRGETPRLVIG